MCRRLGDFISQCDRIGSDQIVQARREQQRYLLRRKWISKYSALKEMNLNPDPKQPIVDTGMNAISTDSQENMFPVLGETDRNSAFRKGDLLNDRYLMQAGLGSGSFGQVFQAVDTYRNVLVAIKAIKDHDAFRKLAQFEIRMLKFIRNHDPDHKTHCIYLLDAFVYNRRQCIVTELYSHSLLDILDCTDYRGVSLNLVRRIGSQLLESLLFLRSEGIIHCDLKPENVLLVQPNRSEVKLIDFGSSCFDHNLMFTYVQSRFYRSPEIILGLHPYTCAIDMWSLGCLLVEMHTGVPIFAGDSEEDLLHRFNKVLGPIPEDILRQSTRSREFLNFDSEGVVRLNDTEATDVRLRF